MRRPQVVLEAWGVLCSHLFLSECGFLGVGKRDALWGQRWLFSRPQSLVCVVPYP